ncbi:MutH/Sau3AI family endonuclease [Bacillus sp. FSL W7-1334]|uniref:MutH/Sau3AI family endonuclease n=1 Tax=Bacillus sp. FSL W7-1334 TaxID=2921703 RepID=UPI0030FCF58B|nr:restriction endonuclease [Bacillus cereus]
MADHIFTREELDNILRPVVGKTLGEVDINHVFNKTKTNPKITGIAGDVVEQSILGYPPDTKQKADLLVDGIDTELKTTGLKRTKRGKHALEAKEPMSITAVSPKKIVNEQFFHSTFWNKIEHSLLVYYLYDSDKTVPASEYANFTIQGYQFHTFSETDIKILKNDWTIVRDFIKKLQETLENPETEYPKISKLRDKMMYIDTAPKWPNPPRFRLKRSVVNTIVQGYLGEKFEPLQPSNKFSSYTELDRKLHDFTTDFKGQTVEYIANTLNIPLKRNTQGKVNKAITEQIITHMFGSSREKLRKIDTFAKLGMIPKTMIQTMTGGRTEDMKFDTINFDEWTNQEINFEESYIYDFFSNQSMLFIIFKETDKNTPLEQTVFEGFKRIQFDDDFLYNKVKPVWDRVRELVWNNKLKVSIMKDKNGNTRITPKTGLPMEETNFPKSKDSDIFLRGTGNNATTKTLVLNGQRMYQQQVWLKGSTLVNILKDIPYL